METFKNVSPNFRTGAPRVDLHYVKLPEQKAQNAFCNLIRTGDAYIKLSYPMALAMSDKPLRQGWRTVRERKQYGFLSTVHPRLATLFRRAWDGLGLVDDFPGRWNPEKFDKARFDHSELDRAYTEYSDWSDLNEAAELYVKAVDSDAYRQLTEGYDVYVISRNLFATDTHDNKGVAFGDIESIRCRWSLSPRERVLGGEGVQRRDTTQIPFHCYIHDLHTPPPATVLLLKKQQKPAWSHRRSRSPSCLMATMQRPLSVPELEEMTGTPRRTVYDRINRQGLAVKIAEGQYWCICHPVDKS